MPVTVSMSSSYAVNCASGLSKFLHRCCLTIRVLSADSTCWSLRTTQPFVASADVGVNSTMTASMRICASLKWYATRQHHVASLSLSTATTQRFSLRSLLDVHAPVSVRAARTARWYDEDCRRQKKETHRLVKLYHRNNLRCLPLAL